MRLSEDRIRQIAEGVVDVLYDERIKLVASAEAPPEELFVEGENSADFQRTASRLHEMQSAEYRLLPVRRVALPT